MTTFYSQIREEEFVRLAKEDIPHFIFSKKFNKTSVTVTTLTVGRYKKAEKNWRLLHTALKMEKSLMTNACMIEYLPIYYFNYLSITISTTYQLPINYLSTTYQLPILPRRLKSMFFETFSSLHTFLWILEYCGLYALLCCCYYILYRKVYMHGHALYCAQVGAKN